MKNVKYLLTVLLIAIIGCTQDSVINEVEITQKVYISVSIMQSRTILPQALDLTKLKYCLTGKMNEMTESETLGEFSYDELIQAKIPVWIGVWNFTLTAKKGIQNVLIGTLSAQSVSTKTHNLEFSMRESEIGNGYINVSLQMPIGATVAKIEATLTDLSGDVVDTQSLNVQAGDDYHTSQYCETVNKGYYRLKAELYQDMSDDAPINIKTVIVQVEPGCESSGTVSFDKVNTYWAIKYNCNGLDFVTDYVPPNKYNSYTQISLPTSDKIANGNSDIYIIGWSSTNGDRLFDTTDSLEYNNTGDKEYYLKYINLKDIRVSVAELEQALSLTDDTADAVKITITDSNPDLSAVRDTIKAYPSKKIYLNLSECSGLASIDSQLKNWTQLVGIDIPDSVTSITGGAFSGCSSLESITIPFVGGNKNATLASSSTLFGYIFGKSGYSGATQTKQYYNSGNYSCETYCVPSSLKNVTVTGGKLFYGAFYNCSGLTSVTIPDGVTSIGGWTFSGCSGLTSVTIPDSVTSIGECAFRGCSGLTSIAIPDSVTSIGGYAFYYCSGLTSVTIGSGVTSIGRSAFEECSGLTKVNYTGTIAQWCGISFAWKSNPLYYAHNLYINDTLITELVIPDGVTSIGQYAFYYCSGLTSVTIGSGVASIEMWAFDGCRGLTSVTIPDSVTSIEQEAFSGCSGLTSITIPDGVTSIGKYAFYGCSGLTSVTIPDSVTSIGGSAFSGCSGLKDDDGYVIVRDVLYGYYGTSAEIVIPSGVASIEMWAFDGCSGLTSVIIPDSVTSIGQYAFSGCSSLESITIPFVGGEANATSAYYDTLFGYIFGRDSYDGATATNQYYGSSATYYIPSSLKNVTVTGGKLLDGAFSGCSGLTSVTIGDGVTSIGERAFSGCSGLTSVTIGDGVTSIEKEAFSGCSSLESITIPFVGGSADATEASSSTLFGYIFGRYSYDGATATKQYYASKGNSYETYYIPSSLKNVTVTGGNILYGAFYNCSGLTSVTIGDEVTSIGKDVFYNCNGLTKVNYTGTIAQWCNISFNNGYSNPLYYAHNLYNNDTHITEFAIPNGVTSIGQYAFYYCSSLTSVTIPDTVTSIGKYAFWGCGGLTNIVIPDSVTSTGQYAFSGCSGLQDENGYVIVNNVLCSYTGTATEAVIPDGVTSILENAFYYCSSLTSVIIPDSVTNIGQGAFSGCSSLVSITIPFVGGSADATEASESTLFGYIFGSSSYSGSIATKQYYADNSYETYYIPRSLKNVTVTGGKLFYGAFYGCYYGCYEGYYGLTSVTIGDGVTSIGERAFYDCSGLTSVTIGDGVTSIGGYAFYYCSVLTSVTIGSGVTSIGGRAFEECSGLTKVNYTETVAQWCGISFAWKSNPLYYAHNLYINDMLVTELVIPDGVTSIGDYAFEGCSSLTSVTIPDSVTSIGNSAFKNCSSLTSVTIPDSVTSIGNSAFSGCSSLESITIPFIGDSKNATSAYYNTLFGYIFGSSSYSGATETIQYYNSSSSRTYYIPSLLKNVTVTGGKLLYGAFYNCKGLTSVTMGEGVTSIGKEAFRGCSGLTSVTIPDSVTSIGQSAFVGCSRLTSVTIPDSVTSIGQSAFKNCSGLTSVIIPDSVTNIPSGTFSGCSSLESMTIPFVGGSADATKASESALFGYIFGCDSYSGATATKQYYSSESSATYYIPSSLKNVTVTGGKLLYGAFYNCKGLTSVTIGDGVTSIGSSAFKDCSGLTSVTIGDGVTSIGERAFSGCSGLTSVTIPNSVTSIGDYAFCGCRGLTSVTIPDSVTSIGGSAFKNCAIESLTHPCLRIENGVAINSDNCAIYLANGKKTDLVIPDGVTSIGYKAFFDCSGLTSVTIPDSVTSIGQSAFWGCSGLTNIVIPDSVTSTGQYAFQYCSGLTKVNYTGTIAQWCGISFDGLNSNPLCYAHNLYINNTLVTDLVIPNEVTSIKSGAFYGCSSLTSVTIPNSVTSIGDGAFRGCSGLTSIAIPNSVTSIGDSAFYYCSGLTSVTIGSGVTSIDRWTFDGCSSLTSVTIPNSVTSIETMAFYNCSSLKTLYVKATTPPEFGSDMLYGCSNLTTIYVPTGYVSAYKSASGWSDYSSMIAGIFF